MNYALCIVYFIVVVAAFGDAFHMPHVNVIASSRSRSGNSELRMADVEIVFPNKKKAKAAAGSPLKDAAKKAGFKPNYACSEGKCGSCELKMDGKKKIRPCVAKVPKVAGPITLAEP